MNAKEVRIGNWVLTPMNNEIVIPRFQKKIKGITIFGEFDFNEPTYPENHLVSAKHCAGIELTPEILEKCGLRVADTGYYWIAVREHYNASNDLKPTWLKIKYTQAKNFRVENFANKTIYLKSLHQLQNLYFALTGEELEINL